MAGEKPRRLLFDPPLYKYLDDNIPHVEITPYRYYIIFFVFIFGVADLLSTFAAYTVTSVRYETNPIMRQFLSSDPLFAAIGKFIAVFVVAVLAILGEKHIRQVPYWKLYMKGHILIGFVVVFINFLVAARFYFDLW